MKNPTKAVMIATAAALLFGTVAANLLSDRNLATSVLDGIWNAGEAALVAWLLERWFNRPFAFTDLRRVVGFFVDPELGQAGIDVQQRRSPEPSPTITIT